MAKAFIMVLIVLLGLPLHIFAGEITNVKVGKNTQDEIEILIEGTYGAYQGIGMRSPARFVIDLEGVYLGENAPFLIEVEGPIVAGIKIIGRGNDVRVVLKSADSKRLFHCTMHDERSYIMIKCWMPKEAQESLESSSTSKFELTDKFSTVSAKKDLGELFGWPAEEKGKEETKDKMKFSKYTGEKITMDFYKTDLHNVFRLFSEMSSKNFIVDDKVKGELTLALKEVPWDEAMDLVLDLKDLVKQEKLGTTIIMPKPEKKQTGKGELVVKKFSEEILQPARQLKQEKENRQNAQKIISEAHRLEMAGKKEEALSLYEEAYSKWKDNFDLIMKTASLYYASGRFARCYYCAGQALKLNPKNSEAALYAAISAARMDNTVDARQLFELAVKSKPKIPEAFFNCALFLKKQKDYQSALGIYKQHEELFGPGLEVRMAVAGLYEIKGETRKACSKYKQISKSGFQMDKKTKRVIRMKIQTLCKQGED